MRNRTRSRLASILDTSYRAPAKALASTTRAANWAKGAAEPSSGARAASCGMAAKMVDSTMLANCACPPACSAATSHASRKSSQLKRPEGCGRSSAPTSASRSPASRTSCNSSSTAVGETPNAEFICECCPSTEAERVRSRRAFGACCSPAVWWAVGGCSGPLPRARDTSWTRTRDKPCCRPNAARSVWAIGRGRARY
jgi:hypothetical protein